MKEKWKGGEILGGGEEEEAGAYAEEPVFRHARDCGHVRQR